MRGNLLSYSYGLSSRALHCHGGEGADADTNEHRQENLEVKQIHKTLSGSANKGSFHIASSIQCSDTWQSLNGYFGDAGLEKFFV